MREGGRRVREGGGEGEREGREGGERERERERGGGARKCHTNRNGQTDSEFCGVRVKEHISESNF